MKTDNPSTVVNKKWLQIPKGFPDVAWAPNMEKEDLPPNFNGADIVVFVRLVFLALGFFQSHFRGKNSPPFSREGPVSQAVQLNVFMQDSLFGCCIRVFFCSFSIWRPTKLLSSKNPL